MEKGKSSLPRRGILQLCRKNLLGSIVRVDRQGTRVKRKRSVVQEKASIRFLYLREFTVCKKQDLMTFLR
jgi:hypothetical protein